MKIKIYVYLLLTCCLILGASQTTRSQEGAITFSNGITIAIKTDAQPPLPERFPSSMSGGENSTSADGKTVVHRVLTDPQNKLYFGYDLEVSPIARSGTFKVAFKPLSAGPGKLAKGENLSPLTISKYPEEKIINDGDIISFNTLENPQTQTKLSDLIRITRVRKLRGGYFAEDTLAKDFTVNDIRLLFANASAFVNRESVVFAGSDSPTGQSLSFPGKGNFMISLFPKEGGNWQKIGIVEDNKFSFTFNGDLYEVISNFPIISSTGRWYIWVAPQTDDKGSAKPTADERYKSLNQKFRLLN